MRMPGRNNCAKMALNMDYEAKNTELCSSDDHITSLIKTMESFFLDQQFCDVALVAENDGIKVGAHRMVLSAASEYFLTMFTGSFREANASEVPIKHVAGTTLKSVINFIYTGSIELATDTVKDILKTAHPFQLNSLQEVCCNYITKHNMHSSNCIGWLLFAEQYDLKTLYDTAALFVRRNFMNVWQDEEFVHLDNNEVGKLLSSDDLHVPSEEEVFFGMMSWVDYDRPKREQFIDKLLQHVRFPLLFPKFIADSVQPVCKSTESLQLILKAYKWHLIPDLDLRLSLFPSEQTHLRNFKDMIVAIRGLENSDAILSVGFYYPALKEWVYRECRGLAEGRTSFGRTTIDGKFIIAGGLLTSGGDTDRVDCLDLRTLKWSELPRMSTPRSSFKMVTLNGLIYAVGGYSGERYISSVETYDPVALQWKFVTSLSVEGSFIRVAASLNSLYVSKQNSLHRHRATSAQFLHYAYDTVAKTWNNNWFSSNGELFGTGTVQVSCTNYFLAVSRTNITAHNLENNSTTTIPIENIPSEYTSCLVIGNRIIVYGNKKILDCNPLQNERKAIPELDASRYELILISDQ